MGRPWEKGGIDFVCSLWEDKTHTRTYLPGSSVREWSVRSICCCFLPVKNKENTSFACKQTRIKSQLTRIDWWTKFIWQPEHKQLIVDLSKDSSRLSYLKTTQIAEKRFQISYLEAPSIQVKLLPFEWENPISSKTQESWQSHNFDLVWIENFVCLLSKREIE